ncbi:unnamed protein product [Diamesa serratosioi]
MVHFIGSLYSPLEFGHVIIVSGKVSEKAEIFQLNFLADKNGYEIPLQIDVIFGEDGQIIRNSKINGQLGTAEIEPAFNGKVTNPLISGDRCNFTFYVLIGLDRFHISINNVHFCDYIFRSSLKRIIMCELNQDVDKITQFDHRKIFPFSFPTYQTRLLPNLSFSNDVPAPFKHGNVLVLKGKAKGSSYGSFTLKFLIGRTEKQAFHFDVRFSTRKVARNHSVNDKAALMNSEEETYGGFPFEYNQTFKLAIGFEENGLRISINGQFFCEFPYKTRLNLYSGLKIREKDGMILDVQQLVHFKIDENLYNLDTFSKL